MFGLFHDSLVRTLKLSAIPKFIEFGNEVLDKSISNLGDPPEEENYWTSYVC